MSKNRTRTFRGTYTSNDKKVYHFNARVFSRLAIFGLALALVHAGLANSNDDELASGNSRADFGIEASTSDLELIESIIKEHPNYLKDIVESNYTVKTGDTLSEIAEACGISTERLCYLNNMKPTDIIYPGGVLKTETVTPKSEAEKKILCLESYFYDYVFKSPVAQVATSTDPEHMSQANYYKSIIYGNPKSEAEVDPNSIFGRYIQLYIGYHDENETHTDEEQARYTSELLDLVDDTERELNLGGAAIVIVPFEQYRGYLENQSIKEQNTEPTY